MTKKVFPDLFEAVPQQEAYVNYVDAHWRELMARYDPAILWADMAAPKITTRGR